MFFFLFLSTAFLAVLTDALVDALHVLLFAKVNLPVWGDQTIVGAMQKRGILALVAIFRSLQ